MNMIQSLRKFDEGVEAWLRRFGVATLQFTLGGSYLWFGTLKIFGISPFAPVLRVALPNPAVPLSSIVMTVGVWEVIIGVGLLLPILAIPRWLENLSVRIVLLLLSLQLLTVVGLALFSPGVFFEPHVPYLTVLGEFMIRTVVFLASAMVIAGHLRDREEVEQL